MKICGDSADSSTSFLISRATSREFRGVHMLVQTIKVGTFEHLKEDITIIHREKTNTAINIDFFGDARKQFENFSLDL